MFDLVPGDLLINFAVKWLRSIISTCLSIVRARKGKLLGKRCEEYLLLIL